MFVKFKFYRFVVGLLAISFSPAFAQEDIPTTQPDVLETASDFQYIQNSDIEFLRDGFAEAYEYGGKEFASGSATYLEACRALHDLMNESFSADDTKHKWDLANACQSVSLSVHS